MSEIQIPVSPGELIDKITILRIKARMIDDAAKQANVLHELALLEQAREQAQLDQIPELSELDERLEAINARLWDVEDALREKERDATYDDAFIELARAVYYTNDERAAVKRQINERTGSKLIEEKAYQPYSENT